VATKNNPRRPSLSPGVKELLQKAIRWKELLESGKVSDQAKIGLYEGLSRAKVTQIIKLLNLSPQIQRYILNMPKTANRPPVTERSLRHITTMENHREQLDAFREFAKG
jgi:hypothetical protein